MSSPAEARVGALNRLSIGRCSYCGVANPSLSTKGIHPTEGKASRTRYWGLASCTTCGGMYLSEWVYLDRVVLASLIPAEKSIDPAIPERARIYLSQAFASLHAPSGAIMLAASAVDAMLKSKGLTEGGLYSRIEIAATSHLITAEMGQWAHEVRLEANGSRHADEELPMPTHAEAKRCLDFAEALGQFLFVLPALVASGLNPAAPESE